MVITQTIAGITRESGGPSYSVPSLSAALSRLGVKVTLRTLAADAEQTGGNGYSINIHSKTQGLTGADYPNVCFPAKCSPYGFSSRRDCPLPRVVADAQRISSLGAKKF